MNIKMNNKGFTLIELLAVIVILISVSLVAVGGISSSLENRDEKECEEQKELAIGAAKIYFSLNNVTSVTIGQLKNGNYFSDENKIDRIDNNLNATISLSGNTYVFSGSCSS